MVYVVVEEKREVAVAGCLVARVTVPPELRESLDPGAYPLAMVG